MKTFLAFITGISVGLIISFVSRVLNQHFDDMDDDRDYRDYDEH